MFFLRGKFTHLKLGYEGLWDDHMVFLVSPATSRSGSNFNRNLSCELIPNDGEIVRELITLPPPPLMSEQFGFSNDTPPKKKSLTNGSPSRWFGFQNDWESPRSRVRFTICRCTIRSTSGVFGDLKLSSKFETNHARLCRVTSKKRLTSNGKKGFLWSIPSVYLPTDASHIWRFRLGNFSRLKLEYSCLVTVTSVTGILGGGGVP